MGRSRLTMSVLNSVTAASNWVSGVNLNPTLRNKRNQHIINSFPCLLWNSIFLYMYHMLLTLCVLAIGGSAVLQPDHYAATDAGVFQTAPCKWRWGTWVYFLWVCVWVCVTGDITVICGHMMPLRNRHNSHEVIQIVDEAVCSSRCLCPCVIYGKTLDSSVRSHDVLQYNVGPVFVKLQYHIWP